MPVASDAAGVARCALTEGRTLELAPPAGGDLRVVVPFRFTPR